MATGYPSGGTASGLPTDIRRVVVFHDVENVCFHPKSAAGHVVYNSILRSALACILGEAVAAKYDLTTLSVRYWFTYCPKKPPKYLPPPHILDAFETLGVTKAIVGTKAGAADVSLKQEMSRAIDDIHSVDDTLFVLLTADSDFAHEIRRARHAGITMVAIHGGNSKAAYDSLLQHVRTDWERISTGSWRTLKPRLTFDDTQIGSADRLLARTFERRVCLKSVKVTDAGLILEALTPTDSNAAVHVRITFDNWNSQTDHNARRVQGDPVVDAHRVTIPVPAATTSAAFCLCAVSAANGERWDSNEGKNYRLTAQTQKDTGAQEGGTNAEGGTSKAEQWASIELTKILKSAGGIMPLSPAFSELYAAHPSTRVIVTANETRKAKDFVRLFPKSYNLAALNQKPSSVSLIGNNPQKPSAPSKAEQCASIELAKILSTAGGSMLTGPAFSALYTAQPSTRAIVTAGETRKAKDFVRLFPKQYDLVALDQEPSSVRLISSIPHPQEPQSFVKPIDNSLKKPSPPSKAEQRASIELTKILATAGGSMLTRPAFSALYTVQPSARFIVTAGETRKAKDFVRLFPKQYDLAALDQEPSSVSLIGSIPHPKEPQSSAKPIDNSPKKPSPPSKAEQWASTELTKVLQSAGGSMSTGPAISALYAADKSARFIVTAGEIRKAKDFVRLFPKQYDLAALDQKPSSISLIGNLSHPQRPQSDVKPIDNSPNSPSKAEQWASIELTKVLQTAGGSMLTGPAIFALYGAHSNARSIVTADETRQGKDFVRLFPRQYNLAGLDQTPSILSLRSCPPPGPAVPPIPPITPPVGPPSSIEKRTSKELTKILKDGGGSMLMAPALAALYAAQPIARSTVTANGARKAKDFVRLFPKHYDLAALEQSPSLLSLIGSSSPQKPSFSKAEEWASTKLVKILQAAGGSMPMSGAFVALYAAHSSAHDIVTAAKSRKAKDFVRLFPQHYDLAALEQNPSSISLVGNTGGDAGDKRLSYAIFGIVRSHHGEMPLIEAERLLYVNERDAIPILNGRTVAQLVANFPDHYDITALREGKIKIKISGPGSGASPLEVKAHLAVVTYISRLQHAKAGFERQLADKAKGMGHAAPTDVSYSGGIITIRAHPSTHSALEACAKAFIKHLSHERRVLLGVDRAAFGDAKIRLKSLSARGVGYHLPRDPVFVFQPHRGLLLPEHSAKTLKQHLENALHTTFAVRKILDAPGSYEVELSKSASPAVQQAVQAATAIWMQESTPLIAPSGAAWSVADYAPQLVSFVWPCDDPEATRCVDRVRAELLKDTNVSRAILVNQAARLPLRQSRDALEARLLEDLDVTLRLEDSSKIAVIRGSMLHAQMAVQQVEAFVDRLVHKKVPFVRASRPLARWLQRFLHQEAAQTEGSAVDLRANRDDSVGDPDRGSHVAASMPDFHYCVREDSVVISYLPDHEDEAAAFEQRLVGILRTFKPGHRQLPSAQPSLDEIDKALGNIPVVIEILMGDQGAHPGASNGKGPSHGQSAHPGGAKGRGAKSGASNGKIPSLSQNARHGSAKGRGAAPAPSATPARGGGAAGTHSGRKLRIFAPDGYLQEALAVIDQLLAGHVSVTRTVSSPDNDPVTARSLQLQLLGTRNAGLAALRTYVAEQLAQDAAALRLDVITTPNSRGVVRVTAPSAVVGKGEAEITVYLVQMMSNLGRSVIPASVSAQKHLLNASRDAIVKANNAGVVVLAAAQVAQMAGASKGALLRARLSTGLCITVRRCQFQSANADGVVNAANSQLHHAGGIAEAIANMAGGSFVQECNASVAADGPVAAGAARATGSGQLLALHGIRHVIHAVAPMYNAAAQDAGRQQLQKAAYASLIEAERHGVVRLFMPCLGSGIFDWWANIAAEEIINAIIRFAAMHASGDGSLQEIVLGDDDAKKAEAFRSILQSVIDSASSTTSTADAADMARTAAGPRPVEPKQPAHAWYWEVTSTEKGKFNDLDWIPYDYDQVMQLETALESGASEVMLLGDRGGIKSDSTEIPEGHTSPVYVVTFSDMKQRNLNSSFSREVYRLPLSPTDDLMPLYDQRMQEYRSSLRRWEEQVCRSTATPRVIASAIFDDGSAGGGDSVGAGDGLTLCGPARAFKQHCAAIKKLLSLAVKSKIVDTASISQPRFAQLSTQPELQQVLAKHDASIELLDGGEIQLKHIGRSAGEEIELTIHRVLARLPAARTEFPKTWCGEDGRPYVPVDGASDLATKGILVDVPPGTPEFDEAVVSFLAGGFSCTVERIQRVQNQALWEGYASHREHMEHYCKPAGCNEQRMVHGTGDTDPQLIADGNFDFRFCNSGYYGRGAYFAETMQYSHHGYRHNLADGRSQAFLALVLAGRKQVLDTNSPNLKKPDAGYDSVDGLVSEPAYRAAIVYDLRQCYPQYLVTYRMS